MTALQALLTVQDHDTGVDQLEHRKAHLPERTEQAAVEANIADIEARLAAATERREAVTHRQDRLEEELGHVEARIAEIEKRMYGGTVTASRDLQAMATEVAALKARNSTLEDEALASMEEAEPIDEERSALLAERTAQDGEAERLRAAIAEAEVVIDAEIAAERQAREEARREVSDDLLATYEKLRSKLGGVGAARLVGSSCGGCHLTLPATELDRIRRASTEALVFCDQCGRILVHS